MAASSAVSEPIRELVTLFADNLADVSFPDVDAQRLQKLAATVESTADALAAAEATLAAAREAHAAAERDLAAAADRGIAYALVYASEDDVLLAQLEALPLGPRARRPKPTAPVERKKRRSPPKPEKLGSLPFTGPTKKIDAA